MRGPADSHPEIHRRLAWYHFRKWVSPGSRIPMPSKMTNNPQLAYRIAAILGAVVGLALVVGGVVEVETWVRINAEWGPWQ